MHKILVCGCSSGIGEHLFKHYKNTDYQTVGLSRTSGDYIVDATKPAEVYAAIKDIKPDIIINCIGIGGMNSILTTDYQQYRSIIDANLTPAFLLAREAARGMILSQWGRIINFTSCAASMNIEGEAIYGASKSAVESFSRIISREFRPFITVNCIGIGPVDTRLIKRVPRKKIEAVIDRQIIKRMTTFDDITPLVEFLLSEGANSITGQTIWVNGAG
jgi:3-oxoacyl-[acyl-carrier protein] reductase